MPDSRWTMADARWYLTTSGGTLAPGSMALGDDTPPVREVLTRTDYRVLAPADSSQESQHTPAVITLELPVPVSLNALYRAYAGRVLLSEAGRAYAHLIITRYHQEYGGLPPLEGSLAGTIELYPPDKRRRDLPNLEKLLGDSLEKAGAYHNDAQFDEWHFYRREQAIPGYIRFTIQTRKAQP